MRTLCIADIHGGYKGMIQALERAEFDKDNDTLISLGDIADSWSETAKCVDYLLTCKNLIPIRGNHDEWARIWLTYGTDPLVWRNNGGVTTIKSYMSKYEEYGEFYMDYVAKHRKFFKDQINYYIDDQNRAFVHGGYVSRKGLGHEAYTSNYYWDRDLWNLALLSHGRPMEKNGSAHGKRYNKHKEIFIGHTATTNWHYKSHYPEYCGMQGPITIPMNRCNIWNLDTGGGEKIGKITVMDINTKQYWQSDLMSTLYLNEEGR